MEQLRNKQLARRRARDEKRKRFKALREKALAIKKTAKGVPGRTEVALATTARRKGKDKDGHDERNSPNGAPTCKARPSNKRPSTNGAGNSRRFIPWCGN